MRTRESHCNGRKERDSGKNTDVIWEMGKLRKNIYILWGHQNDQNQSVRLIVKVRVIPLGASEMRLIRFCPTWCFIIIFLCTTARNIPFSRFFVTSVPTNGNLNLESLRSQPFQCESIYRFKKIIISHYHFEFAAQRILELVEVNLCCQVNWHWTQFEFE